MNLNLQLNGDHVIFENAAISLEAVRTVLERENRFEEAQALRGLEVLSPSGAEVALDALRSITAHNPDTIDAVAYAITATLRASQSTFDEYAAA
jgi:predicted dinucleotide-utilizing enzyme